MGVEPTLSAWKAEVLPLNYARSPVRRSASHAVSCDGRRRTLCHATAGVARGFERSQRARGAGAIAFKGSPWIGPVSAPARWWGEADSNRRRVDHQIYSLAHLAALEPPRCARWPVQTQAPRARGGCARGTQNPPRGALAPVSSVRCRVSREQPGSQEPRDPGEPCGSPGGSCRDRSCLAVGASGGNRTHNRLITNHVLCH